MAPFAIGTQTAGSVLRPASYCGVTGFKTSYGLFSLAGVLPYAKSLDTLGFFTHTPADMLLLWEAMGRPAGREEDLAIGVSEPAPPAEPAIMAAFRESLSSLRRAGVSCRPVDISAMLGKLVEAQHTIAYYEGARFHQQRFNEYGDRLGQLAALVREGLKISETHYNEALSLVAASRVRMTEIFNATPVILSPAATGPAPSGLTFTGDARMNAPWTALGTPAISVPMPVGNGLPLGLQLTAALDQDAQLLRTAVRLHRIINAR